MSSSCIILEVLVILLVFVSQEDKCKADSPTSAERCNTTPQSQAKQTLGKMRTNFVRRCKSIKKKVEKLRDKLNCEDHCKNEDEATQVGRLQLLSITLLLKCFFFFFFCFSDKMLYCQWY